MLFGRSNINYLKLDRFFIPFHKEILGWPTKPTAFNGIHPSTSSSSSLECTFIWKSFPRFPFAGKENYYLEFHCRSIISRILHPWNSTHSRTLAVYSGLLKLPCLPLRGSKFSDGYLVPIKGGPTRST